MTSFSAASSSPNSPATLDRHDRAEVRAFVSVLVRQVKQFEERLIERSTLDGLTSPVREFTPVPFLRRDPSGIQVLGRVAQDLAVAVQSIVVRSGVAERCPTS